MKTIARVDIEIGETDDPSAGNFGPNYDLYITVWAEGKRFNSRELVPRDYLIADFDFVVGQAVGRIKKLILNHREEEAHRGKEGK